MATRDFVMPTHGERSTGGQLPLHKRTLCDAIAVASGAPGRDHEIYRVAELLSRVATVSRQLPDVDRVINLCEDRVNFLITMMSAIVAEKCILLPPNRQPGTIDRLVSEYPRVGVVYDNPQHAQVMESVIDRAGATALDIHQLTLPATTGCDVATDSDITINGEQPAVIAFTSGSTGRASASVKTWANLHGGAIVNAANMLPPLDVTHYMLATVPAQHMYGLELSVMLPLFANVCVHHGLPLYPGDIAAALARLPSPRILVSTPTHLRAMIKSGVDFPPARFVFSATSPLDVHLAEQVEARFEAQVIEIYGFSEAGSVAKRHTARNAPWQLFDQYDFTVTGDTTAVRGDHFNEPVELQDIVHAIDDRRFELGGRQADMINIAGKRGSFAELNRHLLRIPGVVDGIVFDPTDADQTSVQRRRLAALVVVDGIDTATIQRALKRHVDPVFVPRPIVLCDQLPRSESSKLPRASVLALYRKLRQRP